MTENAFMAATIAVAAAVTVLTRALPFIAFRKKTPDVVLYLGRVLPAAVMGMLVVYCLRNASPLGHTHALPEIIAVVLVVLLHKWKHNTLLSILCGTVVYMFMVQHF